MKKKENFQTSAKPTQPYKVKDWNILNTIGGYGLWTLALIIPLAFLIAEMFTSRFKATNLLWSIPLLLILIFAFIAGVNATSYRAARPCKEVDNKTYDNKIWDKLPWETFKVDFNVPTSEWPMKNIVCCPNGYTYDKKNKKCVKK